MYDSTIRMWLYYIYYKFYRIFNYNFVYQKYSQHKRPNYIEDYGL